MAKGQEMNDQRIGATVLDAQQIAEGAARVAERLNARYSSVDVITVVPGGILFTADLVRQVQIDVRMGHISCPHTPGERHNTSPIVFHDTLGIRGRDVVLVDDAIESGGTMRRLVDHLVTEYAPSSLAIATLLVKPGRVEIPVEQFFGFEVDTDDLLVGYGLPWEDRLRNLPYVARLA
ncbi:MAG: phosphoribosyltransferase family protein [Brachybacterium sp.]|nr:phosphoribosyltransferase family protein [Brachybacterium sp.]